MSKASLKQVALTLLGAVWICLLSASKFSAGQTTSFSASNFGIDAPSQMTQGVNNNTVSAMGSITVSGPANTTFEIRVDMGVHNNAPQTTDNWISFSNTITVTIPSGQTSATVELTNSPQAQGDVSASSLGAATVTVEATVTQPGGPNGGQVSNSNGSSGNKVKAQKPTEVKSNESGGNKDGE